MLRVGAGALRRSRIWITARHVTPRFLREKSGGPRRSRLEVLEQRLGVFGERLTPQLAGPRNKGKVAEVLRGLLDSRIETVSSASTLQAHFKDLFSGLDCLGNAAKADIMAMTDTQRLAYALQAAHSEQDILKVFDDVYFHGLVSFGFASALLRDPRVRDVEHIARAVSSGGTLIKWAQYDKHFFRLHVANKYWRFGQRTLAADILAHQFHQVWLVQIIPQIHSIPIGRFQMLFRALLAAKLPEAHELVDWLVRDRRYPHLFVAWVDTVRSKNWDVAEYLTDQVSAGQIPQECELLASLGQLTGLARKDPHGLEPLFNLKLAPGAQWQIEVFATLVRIAHTRPDVAQALQELSLVNGPNAVANIDPASLVTTACIR